MPLNFLYPYLLAAFPLILGLLIYVYKKRGRGERKEVATLLLLRTLEPSSMARKKFVPPPRFFFELMLLSLLLLGAAGLFKEGSQRRVAILIDNS